MMQEAPCCVLRGNGVSSQARKVHKLYTSQAVENAQWLRQLNKSEDKLQLPILA